MNESLSIIGSVTNNQADGRDVEKDGAVKILLTQPLEAGPHRSRRRLIYEIFMCIDIY